MKPTDWEEKKEIKIPAKLYEMLERRAQEDGTDTDTFIKYILLDALAPSVEAEGRKVGELAKELGKRLFHLVPELPDEPPDHIN
jgi:hypothetical protein